jgi:hypothetical protein
MLGGPNVATPDTFTSSSSERPSDRAMADASPRLIRYSLLVRSGRVHRQPGLLGDIS